MKDFSVFMISFCSSCVLLGFLYMLCPVGNMAKSVKYVFCLCFLCCVLSGVSAFPKPNFSAFLSKKSNPAVTEQSAAVVAQMTFAEALSNAGINFRKIEVCTNKLYDGSITISRITVYTAADLEEITDVIGSDGYEVCVVNE